MRAIVPAILAIQAKRIASSHDGGGEDGAVAKEATSRVMTRHMVIVALVVSRQLEASRERAIATWIGVAWNASPNHTKDACAVTLHERAA